MLKLYIGQILPKLPLVELIRPNFQPGDLDQGQVGLDRLTERYAVLNDPLVMLTKEPGEAEAILIPHNYNYVKSNDAYISEFVSFAEKYEKKIIIFFPGDSVEPVTLPNSIVFRNSQYRSRQAKNEIILPGYVEDLGKGIDLKPRYKNEQPGAKPVIGFTGWADFRDLKGKIKFVIKSFPRVLIGFIYRRAFLSLQGLWWRRRLIRVLSHSPKITTNFIIRRSYSGNEKTIELDPGIARQEYVENILKSDFILCPKGDGNFSTRFFEVLSLGRIPLLFDTETVLPLEEVIDYTKIIFRVDWRKWRKIDKLAAEFYSSVSQSEFLEMQIRAREVFEKYLRLDSYLRFVFTEEYWKSIISRL